MIDQLKQKAEETCYKANADYVRFLNENSPAKFIEVDGGIEMNLFWGSLLLSSCKGTGSQSGRFMLLHAG
ncbi:hypothetical protein EJ419_00715 [Alloscardovia theropitheci]|uniref:Uncharacterized protein n=1 Tax=Alloscardovia theropitheci TaxID=2496842 RepID=A0A4R0QTS8_9BIFI|nr:hypothetical protein [Alloscardovia theropitheci]TCD54948.1 hypothetical protein EJ419_00715 [Alloscardovia theropitheci]